MYDGQTDQGSLIANYTFTNGKTPESIYSRSSYLFVKLRFLCTYPTNRQLQPIELQQLEQKQRWEQFQSEQLNYEQSLFDRDNRLRESSRDMNVLQNHIAPLFFHSLSFQEQQRQLILFDNYQKEQKRKLDEQIKEEQRLLQQGRIYCPLSSMDEITMFAMVGPSKHPDLVLKNTQLTHNFNNGLNCTSAQSLIQLNETILAHNQLNGLTIYAGAGDVSLSHCLIENNYLNGINLTYAGGLKEFNYTRISNNSLNGVYIKFSKEFEAQNIFQNTTFNSSLINENFLDGVRIGSYCGGPSNITINSSVVKSNSANGLVIESCNNELLNDNRTLALITLNISWSEFDSNRLNGLNINFAQNLTGLITNNTFRSHFKGALSISANDSLASMHWNLSLKIEYNSFVENSGRYALNVGTNPLADRDCQLIEVKFNRFENNYIYDAYRQILNPRSTASGVVTVGSSNVLLNQNWFMNPKSRVQISTSLENFTSVINASMNWFEGLVEPVYDLHYFISYRDKCNQQWANVRQVVFDQTNRANLAEIVYWPYACNERLNLYEMSVNLRPPVMFDFSATDSFGGVIDSGDVTFPAARFQLNLNIFYSI